MIVLRETNWLLVLQLHIDDVYQWEIGEIVEQNDNKNNSHMYRVVIGHVIDLRVCV